jgi:hypothetical protein
MNHQTTEQLGPPDLKAAGFQLWVHGRQFPDSSDYDDGSWLRVTAHVGAAGSSVWASGAILMVTELLLLGHEVGALPRAETQRVDWEPLEPELRVQFEQADSLGHFTMRVQITPDHLTQDHSFEFEIDQTYLRGIAEACRAIASKYPVRGHP